MKTVRSALALLVSMTIAPAALAQGDVATIVPQWVSSAHGDAAAEAFSHWNEEGEVPSACAVCHSGAGFRDFHGVDGSAVGSVDAAIPSGGVVDCDTCHADGVAAITEVTFPSGITMPVLLNAGTCMTCHQGRSSGPTLRERFGDVDPDTPDAELRFLNPHYAAAAATTFGSEVSGLYEYMGQDYAGRFSHAPEIVTCSTCHNPHSLEVATDTCVSCHRTDDPQAVRVSEADFDGDGDVTEGIAAEVEALRLMLAEEIAAYAQGVAGSPIVYAASAYPYFFVDANGNGTADEGEISRDNAYASWTPRLLAAAYNFQFVTRDPGGFAHNPDYTLQALHDSIADLATASGRPMPAIARP